MGQDRVEGLTAVPLVPLLAVRVVPETALQREVLTAVLGAEDGSRLGAGKDHPVLRARHQLPHAGHRRVGVLGEAKEDRSNSCALTVTKV